MGAARTLRQRLTSSPAPTCPDDTLAPQPSTNAGQVRRSALFRILARARSDAAPSSAGGGFAMADSRVRGSESLGATGRIRNKAERGPNPRRGPAGLSPAVTARRQRALATALGLSPPRSDLLRAPLTLVRPESVSRRVALRQPFRLVPKVSGPTGRIRTKAERVPTPVWAGRCPPAATARSEGRPTWSDSRVRRSPSSGRTGDHHAAVLRRVPPFSESLGLTRGPRGRTGERHHQGRAGRAGACGLDDVPSQPKVGNTSSGTTPG